jgi:hypothetical protein
VEDYLQTSKFETYFERVTDSNTGMGSVDVTISHKGIWASSTGAGSGE